MKATQLRVVASLQDTTLVLPRMKPKTRTQNTGKMLLFKIVNMKNSRIKADEGLLTEEVSCDCVSSF